jgi:hypothetical protein
MTRIKVSQTTNEDGTTHAHLKCPPLNGKKPSEIIADEIEYLLKALPVSEAYKEQLRILIGSYGVLKQQNQ